MNKRAMDDYDSLEFESSRRTLQDAVQMLRANGLDETPLAAKTYANLGIVYINGFKDRNRGQQQFVNALKIAARLQARPGGGDAGARRGVPGGAEAGRRKLARQAQDAGRARRRRRRSR